MLRIIITIAVVFFIVYPASAEVDYKQAIEIVKKLPSSEGGTVDQLLSNKAKLPVIEDLGWKAYPREDGFEIERLMLLNKTTPLSYKWHVDKATGKAKPVNGKAIGITK